MQSKQIFVVQGPTASGKTGLAIALAKHFKTEIISFDSRQFYEQLSIGVARPSMDELSEIVHHFVGSHPIDKPLNAVQFAAIAKPKLAQLLQENGAAVLVGGSALFGDALLLGLDPLPHDTTVEAKWQAIYAQEGIAALQKALKDNDPAFHKEVDLSNPVRLVRALEIYELTGQSNCTLRKGPKIDPSNLVRFYIDWPREELYQRIGERVDQMVREGLEEEALLFYPQQQHLRSLQTVGYQEFFAFYNTEFSRMEAIEKIKQHTRNYAKRQLSWLSRYACIHALDPKSELSLLQQALQKLG